MRKTIVFASFALLLLSLPSSSLAAQRGQDSNNFLQKLEDKYQKAKEKFQERQIRKDDDTLGVGVTGGGDEREERGREQKNKNAGKPTHLADATVTLVAADALTVTKDNKTYTILIDSKTKCVRHFWGKCSISEIAVGNKINVWGKTVEPTGTTAAAGTTIQAALIRNLSVMKRFGVFIGDIKSMLSNGFVLNTQARGEQTVTVSSTTKYIGRNEKPVVFADLKAGDRVRVRGLWDKSNNTITQVTQVKDFSLPQPNTTPKPTSTVSVTPAPTVTPTVTPTNTPTPSATNTPTPTPTPNH